MKLIIQISALVIACYGLVGAALYFFQEKMLFFPMGQSFGDCPQMDRYGAGAVKANGVRYYLKRSETPERLSSSTSIGWNFRSKPSNSP